jgi:hypothetical protein
MRKAIVATVASASHSASDLHLRVSSYRLDIAGTDTEYAYKSLHVSGIYYGVVWTGALGLTSMMLLITRISYKLNGLSCPQVSLDFGNTITVLISMFVWLKITG